MARQRARTEEGGLVALAFLFGKADHLEAERQAPALAVQFAHAGHGRQNAQAPVVLAAVAHGVVMRSGQQARGLRVRAVVNANDIADRVNRHLVKSAVALHPLQQLPGAGLVGAGQVGHGEFAALGAAGVGVHAELLCPVPDLIAQRGYLAELVVQANFSNAVNVAQRLGHLEVRRIAQPARKGGDDLGLGQAQATWAAHRQNEREAELACVVGVELPDAGEFFRRASGQAGFALLVRRFGGQRLAGHGLAGQFRVGAN